MFGGAAAEQQDLAFVCAFIVIVATGGVLDLSDS